MSVEARFWPKVDNSGACWLWTASQWGGGYGQFWDGSRNVVAHRFAYELLVGSIPDGLEIDHLCRVRNCVNPLHLQPVTTRENTLRGEGPSAINAVRSECIHGHAFSPSNTYISKDGKRSCRTCRRHSTRRIRAQRRPLERMK